MRRKGRCNMTHPVTFSMILLLSSLLAGQAALAAPLPVNNTASASADEDVLTLPPVTETSAPTAAAPAPAPTPTVAAPAPASVEEAPADAAPAAALPDAANPASPAPAEGAVTPAAAPAQKEWNGTLMFDQEKVDGLMAIYRVYLENLARNQPKLPGSKTAVNAADIVRSMQGANGEKKEIPEEILNLTLNSILYYNDKDWSIWLNGNRYFRNDALEGMVIDRSTIRVLSATRREVMISWTPLPESASRVVQRWQDKQQLDKMNMSPLVAANERVSYDQEKSTVIFVLKPNQTFSSQYMSVLEGKEVKAVLATAKKSATPPEADATASANQPANSSLPAPATPVEAMPAPSSMDAANLPKPSSDTSSPAPQP